MTDDELKAIEQRANAATPGPWVNLEPPLWGEIRTVDSFILIADMPELDDRTADFEFIAAAREDVPALLGEVRQLQAELKRVAPFLAMHGIPGYELCEE